MDGGFFGNVVVGDGSAIVELLSCENEALGISWDAFFVLDLGFDALDGVSCFNIEGNCLASEGLHEDLHTSPKSEDQVDGRLLLNVVVGHCSAVFEGLAREDESLLVGGDAFFVLDLGLEGLDGVLGLHLEGDGLAGQGLNENLHELCLFRKLG